MKLGYIDYLNTYPLYWRMLKESPPPGIEVIPGKPAQLNAMMREGRLEISPVSVACLPEIQDEVYVLPEFCLAATGDVKSVLLVSRRPIEELSDRPVGLSTASETSVVLLKYLLEACYGVRPKYVPHPPMPTLAGLDASLVIGNDALLVDEHAYPYVYDLGRLWLEKMGLPVVFAVFVVRREIAATHPEMLATVCSAMNESLAAARADKPAFFREAAHAYPTIKTNMPEYFEVLKYDFTDTYQQSLKAYFDAVTASGLLPRMKKIPFQETDCA